MKCCISVNTVIRGGKHFSFLLLFLGSQSGKSLHCQSLRWDFMIMNWLWKCKYSALKIPCVMILCWFVWLKCCLNLRSCSMFLMFFTMKKTWHTLLLQSESLIHHYQTFSKCFQAFSNVMKCFIRKERVGHGGAAGTVATSQIEVLGLIKSSGYCLCTINPVLHVLVCRFPPKIYS